MAIAALVAASACTPGPDVGGVDASTADGSTEAYPDDWWTGTLDGEETALQEGVTYQGIDTYTLHLNNADLNNEVLLYVTPVCASSPVEAVDVKFKESTGPASVTGTLFLTGVLDKGVETIDTPPFRDGWVKGTEGRAPLGPCDDKEPTSSLGVTVNVGSETSALSGVVIHYKEGGKERDYVVPMRFILCVDNANCDLPESDDRSQ